MFSAAERTALDLAIAAVATPSGVNDEMRENLKHHYTQEECAEIIAMIAMFAYFQTWNDTNGTHVDDNVIELIENEVSGTGYLNEEKFQKLQK